MLVLVLAGCSNAEAELDRAITLREQLLRMESCSFTAQITADFGETLYTFTTENKANESGGVSFSIIAPETISGITGTVSADGGELTFDGKAVAFPVLAEGEVSPASGPWLMMKALQSGYITSCGQEGELLRVTIDDTYEEDALQVDIWLNSANTPVQAEVVWKGRKILTIAVSDFVCV